jgi:hypothetical protein
MISPPKHIVTLAVIVMALLPIFIPRSALAVPPRTEKSAAKRLLMAHYMPWYQAKPDSAQWGWHWTMNHFNPDHIVNGRRDAASRYYPLIGLYDSGDPDTLQCQVLLMKLAGIDGVIVDWYGNNDYLDYGANNHNTERLIPYLEKAGLRFAVCYETHTISTEIEGGIFPQSQATAHGQRLMQWLQQNFFSSPAFLKLDNRPVLLSFGDPYYTDNQWNELFSAMRPKPAYFTEANLLEPAAAVGAFDWPQPSGGTQQALKEQDSFYARAKAWPHFIPAAFPRFDDVYEQAGVGKSWGHIDDDNGQTYQTTLTKALKSSAAIVQIVTWNDWGEGTQIEPSVEDGYRDLEATQRLRRRYLDPSFRYTAADLRLPVRWYLLRKKLAADPAAEKYLAAFFPLIVAGHMDQARKLLANYDMK